MSDRRFLIAVAHPDDEAFGYGGLITKYVRAGIDVYLIVSTNGDVGTVSPEFLNGYKSVAELRLAELDCASQKLGFKKVFKFGYKDSGMMGSQTSKDPACSWQAPREEMARKVVEVIREVRPQVVLTFNKYGGYGHPDHIAIQRATTDAFTLAGDASYVTEGLEPYQPQKLYYSGMPALMMRWNILRVRLKGQNPRRLGRNQDIDIVKILENMEPTHAIVDVRAYMKEWDEASACHASQLGGGSMPQMPEWLRRRVRGLQRFTRVYPAPRVNRVDERDLFDGVKLDEPLGVA
jgi:LmbE family N-acetylglucosaminyl deacetylase